MKWIFRLFKVTLFICNSFYFVFGLALLGLTVFLYTNTNQLNDLIKLEYAEEYVNMLIGLISFAGVLLLVGFLGCTGILNEKSWLLVIYFMLLFVIFTLQFIGAIYLYVRSLNYFGDFQIKMVNAIKNRYGTSRVGDFIY